MEDIGLHSKPTNDPPVHRPTVSDTEIPLIPTEQYITEVNRKLDVDEDETSRKKSHSETLRLPPCPLQGSETAHLINIAAAKNGNTDFDNAGPGRKTSKCRVAEPSKWKQNKQKQLRMEGKAYVSKRKNDGETVTKQPRAIGPRCMSNACKKASNRLCNDISEDERKRLFEEFWQQMNWAQRKVYVAGLVDRDPVERSRAIGTQSRRSVSLRYHLRVKGKRKQVCKNMFLSTLGIGEWSVLNWAQKEVVKKSDLNKNKSVKTLGVPPHPQQNNAPSTITNGEINLSDHVSLKEKDKNTVPEPDGPTKKKSRVAKPLSWMQNRQKQLRMEGKPYISKRKKDGTTVTKEQRLMGARCTSNACKRASNRFCADINDETRRAMFDDFWQGMNWSQRKVYVAGLVDRDPVERTRAPWTESRRSVSLRYHLVVDGDRKQVCKKMFLSTLGVGEWSILNWTQNAVEKQMDSDGNTKKGSSRKSRKASEHSVLREFLESLPKVPSYYCATSISKLYLEPVFSNMSEVYRHYHNHCLERQTAPLSRQVFCAVFKKMDLGLRDPKKEHGGTGNLFNELWEEYCLEREVAVVGEH